MDFSPDWRESFSAEACNAECKIIFGRRLWRRDFEGRRVRAERSWRTAPEAVRLPLARPGRTTGEHARGGAAKGAARVTRERRVRIEIHQRLRAGFSRLLQIRQAAAGRYLEGHADHSIRSAAERAVPARRS